MTRLDAAAGPTADDLTAGEIFRVTSRSALDYVFRHGLDVAETFVLVFVAAAIASDIDTTSLRSSAFNTSCCSGGSSLRLEICT